MLVAVEFDGTIVENDYPKIGKERPMAFLILNEIQFRGNKIILWTRRDGEELNEAIRFCQQNGFHFDAVNIEITPNNQFNNQNTSIKLKADVYIDSRNLGGIPAWNEIFWTLYPDEFRQIQLKHSGQKKGFIKRISDILLRLLNIH
jgi:hypothetical protein